MILRAREAANDIVARIGPLTRRIHVSGALGEPSPQDSVVRGIDQMAHPPGGARALLRRRP